MVTAAVFLLVARSAEAGLISPFGSQGFGDLGAAVARQTNNIDSTTTFVFGNLISTAVSTGFFAGLPTQLFGPTAFSITDPLSLQFGNAEFGTFASTTIRQLNNDRLVGSRSFVFDGMYTKGTFGTDFAPNPAQARFTLNMNQNAGTGTAISMNATLELLSVQPVPEPTTLTLLAVAAGIGATLRARSRRT